MMCNDRFQNLCRVKFKTFPLWQDRKIDKLAKMGRQQHHSCLAVGGIGWDFGGRALKRGLWTGN